MNHQTSKKLLPPTSWAVHRIRDKSNRIISVSEIIGIPQPDTCTTSVIRKQILTENILSIPTYAYGQLLDNNSTSVIGSRYK